MIFSCNTILRLNKKDSPERLSAWTVYIPSKRVGPTSTGLPNLQANQALIGCFCFTYLGCRPIYYSITYYAMSLWIVSNILGLWFCGPSWCFLCSFVVNSWYFVLMNGCSIVRFVYPVHPNRSIARALPPTDWSLSVSARHFGSTLSVLYIKYSETSCR